MLNGFNVVANPHLVGFKKAVRMGNTIVVSPAVLSLLKSEQGPALERLLRSLGVVDIPEAKPIIGEPLWWKGEG